ncbi:sensor histidine kinase, partial [Brevibacterium sediminis]|uniref:sensor histidine kinase n=1 Tax=Brevibacterium sediminis TaxID=1857024 RepID=UPI003B3B76AA
AVPALVSRLVGSTDIRVDDRRATDSEGVRETPGQSTDAAAYRIIQEALTNVLRHAGAGSARVVIARHSDRLQVRISDDGTGLPDGVEGTGIMGMRERAKLLKGSLTLTSKGRQGTVVDVDLPWNADHAELPDEEPHR